MLTILSYVHALFTLLYCPHVFLPCCDIEDMFYNHLLAVFMNNFVVDVLKLFILIINLQYLNIVCSHIDSFFFSFFLNKSFFLGTAVFNIPAWIAFVSELGNIATTIRAKKKLLTAINNSEFGDKTPFIILIFF